jgi:hypothetical protein
MLAYKTEVDRRRYFQSLFNLNEVMNCRTLTMALCLSLAGCASPSRLAYEAMGRGDLVFAEKQYLIAAQQGDYTAWYELGYLYSVKRDEASSIRAYTMSARYGNQRAAENLKALKAPIPSVDLLAGTLASQRQNEANNSAGTLLILESANTLLRARNEGRAAGRTSSISID